MGWWAGMSDRVGEVRYQATISFGTWVTVGAAGLGCLITCATLLRAQAARETSTDAQISALRDTVLDLKASTQREIADMKASNQHDITDLLNRLASEAAQREKLDDRLNSMMQQRRGDAGGLTGHFP
jgi:hypothetical protein